MVRTFYTASGLVTSAAGRVGMLPAPPDVIGLRQVNGMAHAPSDFCTAAKSGGADLPTETGVGNVPDLLT